MSIGNSDITQAALDIITADSPDARVITQRPGGNPVVWFGRLTGLASQGDAATITLSDVHIGTDGQTVPGHVLLDVDAIIDITPS